MTVTQIGSFAEPVKQHGVGGKWITREPGIFTGHIFGVKIRLLGYRSHPHTLWNKKKNPRLMPKTGVR